MARLEKYADIETVDEVPLVGLDIVEKIQKVIGMYSEEDVRKIDNTAAAFYRWVCLLVNIF